jgi:four helix bundle protein
MRMSLQAEASRLRVHQLASGIAVDAERLARTFRGPGAFARGDQLVRAALSVSSNIAEACGRGTVGEFRQFLSYALGSAKEIVSQLRIAARMDPRQSSAIRRLENQVILAMKMIDRLAHHPPPIR